MELAISIFVFIFIIAVCFPAKSLRAMMVRKRLLMKEQGERVKRKGILEQCTPYVISLFTLFNIRLSHAKREQINERLIHAGYEEKMSIDHFITFKTLSAAAGFIYALTLGMQNQLMLFMAPIIAWLGFQIPNIWLNQRIRVRQDQIRRELPHILNSISILCEAGMNLFASLREVSETRDGVLPEEIQRVIKQVGAGMPQAKALEQLTLRCQVDEVSRFVSAVTQTLERGSAGITNVLRQQASEVWETRKKRAQQLGEQASMKLFLPLVLLAFPAMMIFILGPVAINLYEFFL
ncbi:type II secretion system F family protein [bacterium LRH843]|nr:type II secretion system F family protein [bacterium LRH843]